MTPTRLRECLALLAWSQRGLASLLGRQEGTVRQWARGVVQIPDDVARWLEVRSKHAQKYPPPTRGVSDGKPIELAERRLTVRESDVCWLYPDGSHRCVTQGDVDELNTLRAELCQWRAQADRAAANVDPRDAEALAMGLGDLKTWLGHE